MTEIVKASTDAEFLSLVPELAGYTATNSAVIVAFSGTRAWGAFRVDLPSRARLSDYRVTSTQVLGMLARLPRTDGVAIVLYTDATFEAERGIPWHDFAQHLHDRVRREGYGVANSLCVAADGWASYFDRDRPAGGHPLEEIVPRVDLPDIAAWSRLPEITEEQRVEYLAEVAEIEADGWPVELAEHADSGPVGLVEAIIEWEGVIPLTFGVELMTLASIPPHRDVIMLQIAFGEIVAESVERDNLRYLEIQAETGGSMDDVVRAEIAAGRTRLDDEISGLLMGVGRIRPDAERTARMIGLFRELIAMAPVADRPGPLCILAWLLWARGLGSAAGVHIDQALEIDPGYGMAQLLHTMCSHGRMPEWAFG
jgi:hypothetical protein